MTIVERHGALCIRLQKQPLLTPRLGIVDGMGAKPDEDRHEDGYIHR